jgi:hypothetical protein
MKLKDLDLVVIYRIIKAREKDYKKETYVSINNQVKK